MIQTLSQEDFDHIWAPIRDRLTDGKIFLNPDWRQVPIPLYWSQGMGPPCWRVREDPEIVDEFAPLRRTLAEFGIQEICCGSATGSAWDAYLLTPGQDATSGLNRLTSMHGEWRCWFSREGNWCLLQREEWFSVLGGSTSFMDAYLRHAGGMDAVRKRFEDYDIAQAWEPSWDPSWSKWRTRTYAEFGWVAFDYPNQGEFFERRPPVDEVTTLWLPRLRSHIPLPLPPRAQEALPERWRKVAFAGHLVAHAETQDIKAFLAVLAEREDWEIGLYSPRRDRWSVVVADDISLGTATEVAGDLLVACGGKNDWVLLTFPEGASVLAAEDAVIDRFLERAGGKPAIMSRLAMTCLPASVLDQLG